MRRWTKSIAVALAVACSTGRVSQTAAGEAPAADLFDAIRAYEVGQSRKGLIAVGNAVRKASAKRAARTQIERKLLALLKAKATVACRKFVCEQLALIGSAEAVPALAALLGDEKMSHMARYALEQIPDPAAVAALRGAMGKLKGAPLVGVVNSLGVRRDAAAVPLLAKLVGEPDGAVASAAASALGKIGGKGAVDALAGARRSPVAVVAAAAEDGCLACACALLAAGETDEARALFADLHRAGRSRHVRLAAFAGLARAEGAKAMPRVLAALGSKDPQLSHMARRLAEQLPGADATQAIPARLASASPEQAVVLLDILAARGDPQAVPAVNAATGSRDASVRMAALRALGSLGDERAVVPVVRALSTGSAAERAAARDGLVRLKGQGVDARILQFMGDAAVALRAELIGILAARNATTAVPDLLKSARDADAGVRAASLKALGTLADAKALGGLVALLLAAATPPERAAAERAIAAVIGRTGDKDKAAGPVLNALEAARVAAAPRCALLRLAGRLGGARALGAVRTGVKDASPEVKDAAIRVLVAWPTAEPMADALAIARSAASKAHRVLALRGFLRMAALPGKRPVEETVALYADAMTLVATAQEKKTILSALTAVHHPKALEMALGCLDDPAVTAEAAMAAVEIAKLLLSSHSKTAMAALKRVAESAKSPDARNMANDALRMASLGANIARLGKATSPDGLDKDGAASGDQAAIDGNPATYWDEVDGKRLYRLVVTFGEPKRISAVSILGYQHHGYSPKDFEVLCDGKSVRAVRNATYTRSFLVVTFPTTSCKAVELKITGYYGRSPAIRELGIFEAVRK